VQVMCLTLSLTARGDIMFLRTSSHENRAGISSRRVIDTQGPHQYLNDDAQPRWSAIVVGGDARLASAPVQNDI
jgi:hypothetical protein